MSLDAETLVFFDASCLIAAAGSPGGGSGFLLDVCRRGYLQAAGSPQVLIEAERNIRSKLPSGALATFHSHLAETPMQVVDPLPLAARRSFESVVGQKDEHVLAAVVECGAPFLLTLDQALAERVNAAGLGVRALPPGEFIKAVLPDHTHYRSIR